jgi:hypothetical protein
MEEDHWPFKEERRPVSFRIECSTLCSRPRFAVKSVQKITFWAKQKGFL